MSIDGEAERLGYRLTGAIDRGGTATGSDGAGGSDGGRPTGDPGGTALSWDLRLVDGLDGARILTDCG